MSTPFFGFLGRSTCCGRLSTLLIISERNITCRRCVFCIYPHSSVFLAFFLAFFFSLDHHCLYSCLVLSLFPFCLT
jgi:hypothetical protein